MSKTGETEQGPTEREVKLQANLEGLAMGGATLVGGSLVSGWLMDQVVGENTSVDLQEMPENEFQDEYSTADQLAIIGIGLLPIFAAFAVYKRISSGIKRNGGSSIIGYRDQNENVSR